VIDRLDVLSTAKKTSDHISENDFFTDLFGPCKEIS